jgi:hypothetical protein
MSSVLLLIALLACGQIDPSTATCTEVLDVCFVVDGSSSNCETGLTCLNWGAILGFVHNMAGGFVVGPDDTQIALVTFGSDTKVEFNFTRHASSNIQEVQSDIDDTAFPGGELNRPGLVGTLVTQIFNPARGDRSNARNKAVLVTNGAPSISLDDAEAASTALQNDGVDVFVICLPGCSEEFAQRLSSPPKQKGKTYFLVDYLGLNLIDLLVLKEVCGDYYK